MIPGMSFAGWDKHDTSPVIHSNIVCVPGQTWMDAALLAQHPRTTANSKYSS